MITIYKLFDYNTTNDLRTDNTYVYYFNQSVRKGSSFTLHIIFKKKILKRFTWLGKIEEFYLSLDFS